MGTVRLRFALLSCFVVSSSFGATTGKPIYALMLNASMCASAVTLMNLADRTGDGAKSLAANSDRLKAKADLDREAPRALAAAGSNRDLRVAVKEFYVSAAEFCTQPSPQLERELQTKESALQLEMKAAGL